MMGEKGRMQREKSVVLSGKVYSCCAGSFEKSDMLLLKFFAITDKGVCASQSVS